MPSDFLTTIDSDDEVPNLGEPSRPRKNVEQKEKSKPSVVEKDDELNPDFEFDFGGGLAGMEAWGGDEVREAKNGAEVSFHTHVD